MTNFTFISPCITNLC